jgi:hypothetical protein
LCARTTKAGIPIRDPGPSEDSEDGGGDEGGDPAPHTLGLQILIRGAVLLVLLGVLGVLVLLGLIVLGLLVVLLAMKRLLSARYWPPGIRTQRKGGR